MKALMIGMALLALGGAARAEVVTAEAGGFQVRQTYDVTTDRAHVWSALVNPDGWWSGRHTWFGKAGGLTLEPEAGHCFCEVGEDGATALHMTVVQVRPGERLVLRGGLGPLQSMAVDGVMTIDLSGEGETTTVVMTYTVGGWSPGGLAALGAPVDAVLGQQFTRLKGFAEGRVQQP